MSRIEGISELTSSGRDTRLDLATGLGATPSGLVEHPAFFEGFLARPDVAAAGLLAVADVAMARYAEAGLMRRVAKAMDPLVTASGDRLRFESFSACNGVNARLDLLPEGIEAGEVGFGTTNVDVNQPLRNALTRVSRADLLHVSVGDESLTVSSLDETNVEEKVTLPERWVRGCAEVPALAIRMKPAFVVRGAAIAALLRELPSVAPPGPVVHLVKVGATVRVVPHRVPRSIAVTGTSRLGSAARIAHHASTLTVFAGPNDTSGWVFDLPGARFTLVLSPGPYRGFSGEGGLLTLLANPDAEHHGHALLVHLGWTPHVDPHALARDTGMGSAEIGAGLAWLAASGRVGYDLSEQAFFHRDLPTDAAKVLRRSPRLVAAQRLVDSGAVEHREDHWMVYSKDAEYIVRNGHCTCRWELDHSGARGPCKHVLAAAIVARRDSGAQAMRS